MSFLKDKVVIVTGKSKQIYCRSFASSWSFSCHSRSVDRKTQREFVFLLYYSFYFQSLSIELKRLDYNPIRWLLVHGDISVEVDCRKLVETAIDRFQRLDVVINNAAVILKDGMYQQSLVVLDQLVASNLGSIATMNEIAVPYLSKTRGSIVNVNSLSTFLEFLRHPHAQMTKIALEQFSRHCVEIYKSEHVRVHNFDPHPYFESIFYLADYCTTYKQYLHQWSRGNVKLESEGELEKLAAQLVLLQTVNNITHGRNGNVYRIKFDRPERFNALTLEMYEEMTKTLQIANSDPNTHLTVITGNGRFYSSGNDLSNVRVVLDDRPKLAHLTEKTINAVGNTIQTFIDHEKPLIALVNGPAIGFAVTTLALCDLAVASDTATFQTPFTALGYSPEACSSYTFPRIMGHSMASEILVFGKTLSAIEAKNVNLINKILSSDTFDVESEKLIADWSKLPRESLIVNKKLIRQWSKEKLHKVNAIELELEKKRWISDESVNALRTFFNKKKN
ncbi:Enoyl-CoA delta isomerase 2, mitochondrial [Aphelenchoides besseyi]|nr:Enoyl-CoA delta isomerase 2, mitochondrial [Aphelenchoides besseyi]